MANRRAAPVASLTVALSLLFSTHANGADRAARLVARGIALYRAASFRRSLRVLRRAERRAGTKALRARAAFYVGLNYGVLRRARRSRAAFRRALVLDPTLTLDADRYRTADVKRLERVRATLFGTVRVNGRSGVVWVDGKRRGPPPQTLRLPVGQHTIELRAGARRKGTTVVVYYQREHALALHLPAPPEKPHAAGSPPAVAAQPKPTPQVAPASDEAASAWSLSHGRLYTWIAAGLAVGSAGVAIGFGVSAKSDESAFYETSDHDKRQQLRDAVATKTLVTNVLIGVAGGLALTALLLYYFEGRAALSTSTRPDHDDHDDDNLLSWGVGPAGAMLRLRF